EVPQSTSVSSYKVGFPHGAKRGQGPWITNSGSGPCGPTPTLKVLRKSGLWIEIFLVYFNGDVDEPLLAINSAISALARPVDTGTLRKMKLVWRVGWTVSW